jgi:hypothetical protein
MGFFVTVFIVIAIVGLVIFNCWLPDFLDDLDQRRQAEEDRRSIDPLD